LRVRRQPKPQSTTRARSSWSWVGLGGLEQPRTELSGGQHSAWLWRRAIVYTPTLLLLDEPLSNWT